MVRARCKKLAAGEPPGSTKERKGSSSPLSISISRSSRSDLGVGHLQASARVLALFGITEIGAEIEEVVLDAREHGIERGMAASRMEPRQADRGVGLIERAVGLDTEIVFRPRRPEPSAVVPSSPVRV